MRFAILACVGLSVGTSPLRADTYEQRLATQASQLQASLNKRCPARAREIAQLATTMTAADRTRTLARLAPCGTSDPLYHQTMGDAYLATNELQRAEASFRKALALGVTEANQAGLLMALVRQPKLTAAQQAEVRKHVHYFKTRGCTRDDLCTSLAYVGWHLEDTALTRSAADAAIALGFSSWQPFFFGGMAHAIEPRADRAKARRLLLEAKKRGAPPEVDELLQEL
ncbi:MAG: hypothetical protein AB7P03_12980 [Kofleriaceae bacterium]